MNQRRRAMIFLSASVLAIVLSMPADRWVAQKASDAGIPQWLRKEHRIGSHRISIGGLLKAPGHSEVAIAVAVVAVIACRRRPKWHAGLLVVLCGLLSGVNTVIKWAVGRGRPFREAGSHQPIADLHPFKFEPMTNGLTGIINTPNLCFPSGHAALAFATAAALGILFPRGRWAFYAIAAITAVERFLETAHWLSDTVAAAALGIGGAHLIHWLLAPRLFAPASPTRELEVEATP